MGKFWASDSESDCEDLGDADDLGTAHRQPATFAAASDHSSDAIVRSERIEDQGTSVDGHMAIAWAGSIAAPSIPTSGDASTLEEDLERPSAPKATFSGKVFR